MIDVIKLLKQKNLDGFKLNSNTKESFELFFVQGKLETIRKTKTLEQKVTVYAKHNEFLGQSTFSVLASDDSRKILDKIDLAYQNAMFVSNQPYELASGEKLSKSSKSNIKNYDFKDLGYQIYDIVQQEINKSSSKINALEIFINKDEDRIRNSNGLDKKETSYDLFIEAIPTCDTKDDSFELYQALRFGEFDPEQLRLEIKNKLEEVRMRSLAKKPEDNLDCPVVLNKEELAQLFGNFAYTLNYASLYSHTNRYNIGDNLQENNHGDKINLTMKGYQKGLVASGYFDQDGTNYVDKQLIEDGIVKGMFGSSRFAQYTKQEVTGELPCMIVSKGHLKDEQLNKMDYLDCLSFSGIQVDLFNDYIGGEVRLAYLHKDGKCIPLTGFSINAKLSDVLNNIKFSNELTKFEDYYGPKLALINGFEIN